MPGGESGNPISPHYQDAYEAWVEGAAAPFLPGKAKTKLELVPAAMSRAALDRSRTDMLVPHV
jgi:penicillin amidase